MNSKLTVKINLSTWFRIELLLLLLINLNILSKNIPFLTSLFHACVFAGIAAAFLLFSKFIRFNYQVILLVFITVLNLITNFLITENVTFSMGNFSKAASFLSAMLTFFLIMNMSANVRNARFFLCVGTLFGILYLVFFFSEMNQVYLGRGLTMNYSTSNFLGMWISHVILCVALMSSRSRLFITKLCCWGGILLLGYLLLLTHCRSALITILFFFGLLFLGKMFRISQFRQWELMLVCLIPIILPLSYNFILTHFSDQLSFLVSAGKELTNRMIPWKYAFETFKSHPIIGSYCEVLNFNLGQMHNIHLEVLTCYGLPVFVVFFILLYKLLKTVNEGVETHVQYVSLCALISSVFSGSFESGLLSGCLGMYFITAGFAMLCRVPEKYIFALHQKDVIKNDC